MNADRRYDIDWLRVIAIGLLLIYHISIVFQPWAVFIGFPKNQESLGWLGFFMSMLNVWRIPLLFLISGMGAAFAIRKRNWKQLVGERIKRILMPFIFGIFCIAPIHVFLWQWYYNQNISYSFHPAHLWFLANIFAYVLLLSPLFIYLKNHPGGRTARFIARIFSSPFSFLIIMLSFIIETLAVKPGTYELYAYTWHGFVLGMLAFFFGYCMVFSGERFWIMAIKLRWFFLLLASALFLVRMLYFGRSAPLSLIAVESASWIFSILGMGRVYLNRPGPGLRYLSEAAYPVYILHMVFLYAGSVLILPLSLDPNVKFILLTLITVTGCLLSYEFIVRRFGLTRLLFGLKTGEVFTRSISTYKRAEMSHRFR